MQLLRGFIFVALIMAISACEKKPLETLSKTTFSQDYARMIESEISMKSETWSRFETYGSFEEKTEFLGLLSRDFQNYILNQITINSYKPILTEADGVHLKIAYNLTKKVDLGERLSSYYLTKGSISEAMATLKEIFNKSKSKRAGLILAGVYGIEGQSKRAQQLYIQIEKTYGLSFELCQGVLRFHQKQGDSKKAIGFARRCEKKTKDSIEKSRYRYSLGRLFLGLGHFKTARNYFQQSFRFDPSYEGAALALGVIYEEEGSWKKSIKTYEDYINKNPESEMILGQLFDLAIKYKQTDVAIGSLEKLVDLRGSNDERKYQLSRLYLKSNQNDKAKVILEELLEADKMVNESRYFLGHIYSQRSNYNRAIASFKGVKGPSQLYNDASFYLVRSLMEQAKGNPQVASQLSKINNTLAKRGKMDDFNTVRTKTLLAHFLYDNKKIEQAIAILREVQTSANFRDNHQYFLAALLEETKEFHEADALLKNLIKKNPKDAHSLNFLGYSLVSRGQNLPEALSYIKLLMRWISRWKPISISKKLFALLVIMRL